MSTSQPAWKNKFKPFPFALEGYLKTDGTVGARALMDGPRKDLNFAAEGLFTAANLEEFFDTLETYAASKGTVVNWAAFCYDWKANKGRQKGEPVKAVTKRPNVEHCLVQYNYRGTDMQIGVHYDPNYKSATNDPQKAADAALWR